MDYKKQYDLLIMKRKINEPDNPYTEMHHIIPKCMGGKDDMDNLVKLTAKEHYIAHMLLYKHYRTTKLAHAWFSMFRCDPNQKRFFTSKQYENAKKAHINALKETMKGENNSFFGKTHLKETREHISQKNIEWHKTNNKTKDQIQNWIEKVAKKPASQKQKETVSRLSKNMIMLKNVKTGEVKKICKAEKLNFDSNLWKNPASISQRRDTCVHCGKESVAGNISRWHNDNCKQNKGKNK